MPRASRITDIQGEVWSDIEGPEEDRSRDAAQ
jgi:hypothetical protein